MMALLRWITGFVITIVLVVFAVANRHMVAVNWSPVYPALELPLYATALGFMAAGFLLGLFLMGLNTLPLWWTSKRQKRQIKKLEKEIKVSTALAAENVTPVHTQTPAPSGIAALPFLKAKT